ncbi:MAG: nickel-responsive transcriptional regulator NikR [Candidatus Bathyarchaeota archaeon]
MEKVTRISITIPKELLKEFDETSRTVGYRKRSRAVSEAIRKFIAEHKLLEKIKLGDCAGTITYTYNHEVRGLPDRITEIQHRYSDIISSTLHIHLDEKNCLENLMVRGSVDKVKKLVKRLKSSRIENLQYILLPLSSKKLS